MTCKHTDNPPAARFCIYCGAALIADGVTERLQEPMRRRVYGWLNGEYVFEPPTDKHLNDVDFILALDWWMPDSSPLGFYVEDSAE